MKMHSQKYTKIANQFLLGLISVATLPCASAIPTTLSPITAASVSKTSTFQLNTVAHSGMAFDSSIFNVFLYC